MIFSAWIMVLGHLLAIIAAGFVHRSWKIVPLYAGIPVIVGVLLFLWTNAGIGKAMAV